MLLRISSSGSNYPMTTFRDKYTKSFTNRRYTRLSLFEQLRDRYGIRKALYLGSYIHITPSLVFSEVVYVDSFKKTKKLIESQEASDFITSHKSYQEDARVKYIEEDYTKPLDIATDFELLISQYCGFASQAGKKYVKPGGLLLANNSHGDASMAYLDKDFALIAVANNTQDVWHISDHDLDSYFVPKKGKHPTKVEVEQSGRGVDYKKTADDYLFRKVG